MNQVLILKPALAITQTLGLSRTVASLCFSGLLFITCLVVMQLNYVTIDQLDAISLTLLWGGLNLYLILGLYGFVSSHIQQLTKATHAFQQGQYNGAQPNLHNDQVAQLDNSIQQLGKELNRTFERIAQAAGETLSAAQAESNIAQRSADAVSQQAAAISQVATAIEQMSSSIADISQQIHHINEAAQQNHHHAQQGQQVVSDSLSAIEAVSEVMQQTTATVRTLGERSADINQIIEVIEGIANQTNLLALNAAIEAARAGEHGRGFAVVSDEVRQLALRTHDATDQVRELINAIQQEITTTVSSIGQIDEQVRNSLTLNNQVAAALQEIASASNQTIAAMQTVATTVTEQCHVCDEVSAAVDAINQTTTTVTDDTVETKDTALYLETLANRVMNALPGQAKS